MPVNSNKPTFFSPRISFQRAMEAIGSNPEEEKKIKILVSPKPSNESGAIKYEREPSLDQTSSKIKVQVEKSPSSFIHTLKHDEKFL